MNDKYIKVRMGKSNSYLIKGDDGYLLIDAGSKNQIEQLKNKLEKHNLNFNDIKLIVITHVHYDHVGSLKEIKERTNAPVLVHKEEAKLLKDGKSKFPAGNNWIGKIMSNIASSKLDGKNKFPSVRPDIEINDYYNLKGFGFNGDIIHTPGHTRGSITVIIDERHCFVGDTMFSMIPFTVNPPFADNSKELYQSWKKISQYKSQIFYPGHGYTFHRNKFLNSLKRKK